MKRYLKNSMLFASIMLLAGCGGIVPPESNSSNSEQSNISNLPASETSSSQETVDYGEMIISDMTVYTNFPDTPLISFTNPDYAMEVEYFYDGDLITVNEFNYIVALSEGTTEVSAVTDYHETTFTVTSKIYEDAKGGSTTTFYTNRVASMEQKWIQAGRPTGGTVFIGDSFFDTEFWSNFYTIYGDNTFTHGVSSSTTTDWEIFASRLLFPAKPKNIVMHCGTNNVWDDNESASTVVTNTKRFLDKIHSRLPDTKIYYLAIEPRTYGIGGGNFTQSTYDLITSVNNQMNTYCSQTGYLTFIDVTSNCYTSGINVNSNFFRDGCHPQLSNYMVYVEALKNAGLDAPLNNSVGNNTTAFDIANTSGISNTNVNIYLNSEAIKNNYSLAGKLNVTSKGSNAHIQFSFDGKNFDNRFLLWDASNAGYLVPRYAVDGNHDGNAASAKIYPNTETSFELVTTTKHSYLYIDNTLQLVFRNVSPTVALEIGAELCGVSFYSLNVTTPSKDSGSWNNILARSEISTQENNTETTKTVVVM